MMEALLISQELQSAKNARKVAKGAPTRVVVQFQRGLWGSLNLFRKSERIE